MRVRSRQHLLCDHRLPCASVDLNAVLPDTSDVTCCCYIRSWIAVHENQISLEARCNPSAICEVERLGRSRSGGSQSLDCCQSGTHQQFQLAVHTCTGGDSDVAVVCASQKGYLFSL